MGMPGITLQWGGFWRAEATTRAPMGPLTISVAALAYQIQNAVTTARKSVSRCRPPPIPRRPCGADFLHTLSEFLVAS